MAITYQRLLEGVETTLARLAGAVEDPALKETAACAKLALDELFARSDNEKIIAYYAAGLTALRALAGKQEKPVLGQLGRDIEELPASLAPDQSWLSYERHLTALAGAIEALSVAIQGAGVALHCADELRKVQQWEAEGYKCLDRKPSNIQPSDLIVREERLLAFVHSQKGYEKAEITAFKLLPGGFSKQTTLFEVSTPTYGTERLVLRGEGAIKLLALKGQDIANEYNLLRYLYKNTVRIAEPLWLQTDEHPHYCISRHMPGVIRGSSMYAGQPMSDTLLASMACELAKVHATPLHFDDSDLQASHIGGVRPSDRATAAKNAIREWTDYWADDIRRISPTINAAITWALLYLPGEGKPATLVHGDCGANNILIENDEVSALLDWEISHLGDPAEDISWALFNMTEQRERDTFLTEYEKAGGEQIDPFRIKFYEVISGIKQVIALFEGQEKYQRAEYAEPMLIRLGLPYTEAQLVKLSHALDEAEKLRGAC